VSGCPKIILAFLEYLSKTFLKKITDMLRMEKREELRFDRPVQYVNNMGH
jgi:hypothetical protein